MTLIYDQKILAAIDSAFNYEYGSDQTPIQGRRRVNDKFNGLKKDNRNCPYPYCIWRFTYTQLRWAISQILKIQISHRDLARLLNNAINNEDLQKSEDSTSKRNLKPTYYLQTEKARKNFRLKIQHLVTGKRENAYQLLFLYAAFRQSPFLCYEQHLLKNEQELQQFLSLIQISKDDFSVENQAVYLDNKKKSRIIEMSGPRHQVELESIEYLEGYGELNGQIHCRYKLPGISANEFLHKMESSFALEHIKKSMSQVDVEEYFDLLSNEQLVRTVVTIDGERRIDIFDETLSMAIRRYWSILRNTIRIMKLIWTNVRSPTAKEREWVEMVWGKQVTTIFLNRCYEILRKRPKDKNKKYRTVSKEVSNAIRELGYRKIVSMHEELTNKFASIIEQYVMPFEILMDIVYPEFLRDLIAKNEI